MSSTMRETVSTNSRPTVVPLALRARVLASIRAGLSALGGLASVLVGAQAETAFLGWAAGAMLVSIILAGDRRGRSTAAPEPLPDEAIQESWAEIARTDVIPSTVGVALFTVVAMTFNATLAGVMAGILGGMALMTIAFGVQVALAERRLGGALYVERLTRRLFIRKPTP